jgi:hypothetical protein
MPSTTAVLLNGDNQAEIYHLAPNVPFATSGSNVNLVLSTKTQEYFVFGPSENCPCKRGKSLCQFANGTSSGEVLKQVCAKCSCSMESHEWQVYKSKLQISLKCNGYMTILTDTQSIKYLPVHFI